jgi:ABC-2 type transport system permease protein
MSKVLLILRHEFFKHLRRPAFLVATLAIPVVGMLVTIGSLFANQHHTETLLHHTDVVPEQNDLQENTPVEQQTVGYVDNAGVVVRHTDFITPTRFRVFHNEAVAYTALKQNDIDAYYLISPDYLETGEITRFSDHIQFGASDVDSFGVLLRMNLLQSKDMAVAHRLDNVLQIRTVRLGASGEPIDERHTHDEFDSNPSLFFVPYVFSLLLYMAIFSSAGLLLNSVIEEKENRVIEILLTSLQPWQILAGKILGLGTLGLLQTGLWVATAATFFQVNKSRFDFVATFDLPLSIWILTIPYFVLSYLIYASLMAGIGAVVTSTREGSMLTTFLILPVMTPIMFFMLIVERPDGMLATVLSLFPFTAAITMMMRLTLTDVVWGQIAISLLLLAGTVVGCIWVSARLFRANSLLAGKKLTFNEIVRALQG